MLVVTNSHWQLSCAMAIQRNALQSLSDWFLMLNRLEGGAVQLGALASETTVYLLTFVTLGLIRGKSAPCC